VVISRGATVQGRGAAAARQQAVVAVGATVQGRGAAAARQQAVVAVRRALTSSSMHVQQ
jgi:hypothetical protein